MNRRIYILFSLILPAIIFLLIPEATYSQFAVSYKNLKHNYSINLPKNMTVSELPSHEDCDSMIAVTEDGSKLELIVNSDKIYKGVTSSQLSYKSFMPDFKIRYKNIKLAENDYTDISGNPAMYMKVDFNNENEDGTVSQFILLRGEKIYIIRQVASKENYDKFMSEVSGYIYSFQFFESSNSEFYKNEEYNFMLNFPTAWVFDKGVFPVQANNSKGSSVFIEVIKNSDFKDVSAHDLDTEVLIDAFKKKFTDITIISKRNEEINGTPVLVVKYRWLQKNTEKTNGYFVLHYYLIKNSMLYIIQGIVSDTNSDNDEKLIQKSAESFQFTK
ncbi:MAG: hypothetical protein WC139_08655 [Candidatus Kapaibacterium sp.]